MKLGLVAFLCLPLLCRAVVSENLLPQPSEWITLSSLKDQTASSSSVSPMPEGLLSGLSRDQVLVLLSVLETPLTEVK